MAAESFLDQLKVLDAGLGDFAFKSTDVAVLTDGTDAMQMFENQWSKSEGQARLTGRTPLMLERDRILYSDELRRQADKHHLLFHGNQRVARDYSTHTLRVAHVARSVSRRLQLNTDLAEAVALGSKVGAVAFLHVAKETVDSWVCDRLRDIDDAAAGRDGGRALARQEAIFDVERDGTITLPGWVASLRATPVRDGVAQYLPWAAGSTDMPAYSSGQQSYWVLSTNPFLNRARNPYTPQTMYGVWRHSLDARPDVTSFRHKISLSGASGPTQLAISEEHLTHEAVVVRYADDITWVIENLNEANAAAALAGRRNGIFDELNLQLASVEPPDALRNALQPIGNSGAIYTYFIDDLVRTSLGRFGQADPGRLVETEPLIGLSAQAERMLNLMKKFLASNVFSDDRVRLRNETLKVIAKTILDLLYESQADALVEVIERRGKIEMWSVDDLEHARNLINDPTHRVQSAVDAFSIMSDRDVYDFIGLEAL